jgi:plasmid stabilization system protein ParE
MKYKVIVQPDAERDIEEAYAWLAGQSASAAARWLEALEKLVESLETFPERCALAPESEAFEAEIRQLLHGVYRILFTVTDQKVHVLHVRHGARRALTPDDE